MSPQLSRVLCSYVFWLVSLITGILVYLLIAYFTNLEFIMNTLGPRWVLYEVTIWGISILLTSIFFGLSAYKIAYFRTGETAEIAEIGVLGSFGSFLSFCVAGCPACSITLISYLGLSSVLSVLPYSGSELRIIGVLVMTVALFYIWRDLEVCKLPSRKKKNPTSYQF